MPRVGCSRPDDGAQERALPCTVRAEQRRDLTFGHLDVHVEQDLLGAVGEVEVAHLERGDVPARAASFRLLVALEHVFDHERDVAPHPPRTQHEEHPADCAHRAHRRERDPRTVVVPRGTADRAEEHSAGEPPDDEAVHAEQCERQRPHLGGRSRRDGLEDRGAERREHAFGEEPPEHHHPQLGRVQRRDVDHAERDEARTAEVEDGLRSAPEHAVADEARDRDDQERREPDDEVDGRPLAGVEVPDSRSR